MQKPNHNLNDRNKKHYRKNKKKFKYNRNEKNKTPGDTVTKTDIKQACKITLIDEQIDGRRREWDSNIDIMNTQLI